MWILHRIKGGVMKLLNAIEIAQSCGLETVGEAIYNIKIHLGNLFNYGEENKEYNELLDDYKYMSETYYFNEDGKVSDVFRKIVMTNSKEKSKDEVRKEFLNQVRELVFYWDKINQKDTKEKLSGLAFSILTLLDGCSMCSPKFIVAPDPHPEDKEYHIENKEDYYPENYESDVKCDISGCLHELFYK
jgi:hypothetical protein